MAAKGVANDADALTIDLWQRGEQVDGATMVDNPLHRATGIAVAIGIEVVLAEVGIVWNDADVASFGQFARIMKMGESAKSGRFILADRCRLVEAEHGGGTAGEAFRNEQPGGNVIIIVDTEGESSPGEARLIVDLKALDGKPG